MWTGRQTSAQGTWLLMAVGMALVTSIATRGAVQQDAPTAPQDRAIQSDDELAKVGEPLVNEMCGTNCHGPERLDGRRTVNEWNSAIAEMVDRGLAAAPRDLAIVRQYLKRFYGIVAVNTASAEELSAVLGLSAKDAKAVVDYRSAHGRFADADALKQVPQIDKSKIDEQPEALRFK